MRHEALETMVLLLNPVTPHASHALWQVLGHKETLIEDSPGPQADPAALVRDSVTLAVQVNGKLRGTMDAAPDATREQLEAAALVLPRRGRGDRRQQRAQGDRGAGQDRERRGCLMPAAGNPAGMLARVPIPDFHPPELT